ncbi:hypothetical protein MMC18_003049 [Xylographa bjoerkii]|nr:hypothetical protein [Xylographa bjoerkii]
MGSLPDPPIRRIAIVGGGPAGVAAAKYLIAENCFENIDIYEQQATTGGAWNYSELTPENKVDVPQTNPNQPLDQPSWRVNGINGTPSVSVFTSPMYDRLETNIPKPLMRYSDTPFPTDCQLFPHRDVVTDYLERYAEEVKSLIQFQTQVIDVRLQNPHAIHDVWTVQSENIVSGKRSTASYDAVVVSNGHYTIPFVPSVPGMEEWNSAFPSTISHSKFFRRPEEFLNKKVLVVGNAASGVDIAAQIVPYCAPPLLMSSRSESFLLSSPTGREELPEITEFISPSVNNRAVRFSNGRVEADIDAIVYCTGYLYSYPFLPSLHSQLISDGLRVQNLFQHIFYIEHPSLAFLTLPMRILPFPLCEAQAAVVARVWSNRLRLPSAKSMHEWEVGVISEKGDGKGFHAQNFPEDFDYHNFLYDWAAQTDSKVGKMPHRWDEKERWLRQQFPAIKKAFADLGEERHHVTRVEELGFDYDASLEKERKIEDGIKQQA